MGSIGDELLAHGIEVIEIHRIEERRLTEAGSRERRVALGAATRRERAGALLIALGARVAGSPTSIPLSPTAPRSSGNRQQLIVSS